jgi:hypothetical protein
MRIYVLVKGPYLTPIAFSTLREAKHWCIFHLPFTREWESYGKAGSKRWEAPDGTSIWSLKLEQKGK